MCPPAEPILGERSAPFRAEVAPFEARVSRRCARILEPFFSDPLPLVVEVWSPSTGRHDVETRIPVYQQRGDLEIWRIHPYERTVTSWVRQDDGSYQETVYRNGTIQLAALSGVEIAVDDIFDF